MSAPTTTSTSTLTPTTTPPTTAATATATTTTTPDAKERDLLKRTLRLAEDIYGWAMDEAKARGMTIGAFVEMALEAQRQQQASGVVQEQAGAAITSAVSAGVQEGFDHLVRDLGVVFDLLTLEAVRARMTTEELTAYIYDSSDLDCPHCHQPYREAQLGPTFASQRSQVILQKAREALAAGVVPRIRPW